jgi:hypothetical protein
MSGKSLGSVQAVLLLLAIVVAVFALIDWQHWNGLDLLALILWAGALFFLNQEPNP